MRRLIFDKLRLRSQTVEETVVADPEERRGACAAARMKPKRWKM